MARTQHGRVTADTSECATTSSGFDAPCRGCFSKNSLVAWSDSADARHGLLGIGVCALDTASGSLVSSATKGWRAFGGSMGLSITARLAKVGAAMMLIATLVACGPPAADGQGSGPGTGPRTAASSAPSAPNETPAPTSAPLTFQSMIDATRTSPGARMATTNVIKGKAGDADRVITCKGHIKFEPTEVGAWSCTPDRAFAESMTRFTGKSVTETIESMSSKVVMLDGDLYNYANFDGSGSKWFVFALKSKDKCLSDATGYCGSPGNLLYTLDSQPWQWTSSADQLTGRLAQSQGGADLRGTAVIRVDSRQRLTSLSLKLAVTSSGGTLNTVQTLKMTDYGNQPAVKGPATFTRP